MFVILRSKHPELKFGKQIKSFLKIDLNETVEVLCFTGSINISSYAKNHLKNSWQNVRPISP